MDLKETIDHLVFLVKRMEWEPIYARESIPEIRKCMELLDYHTTPKKGWQPTESSFLATGMSCNQCSKSWNTPDACLLNFNGVWLCREHHPPLSDGGVRPPGYSTPMADQEKLDAARKEVFLKLSVEERKLINSRIV